MGQNRSIRSGINVSGFGQFLNQCPGVGAAVYILVGLDQGLGRITEIGPGGKIGMRGKVQAVQDARPTCE